jgi:MFS family permease
VLLGIFGAAAGQAVIWYTGHFYSLQFLTSTLKLPAQLAHTYLTMALVLGTPFFIFFGWLSDKLGRKGIMMAGCLLSAILFIPIFQGLEKYGNPALHEFREKVSVRIEGDCREDQSFMGQLFQPKATKPCTRLKSVLTGYAVPYTVVPAEGELRLILGEQSMPALDEKSLRAAFVELGMPIAADPQRVNGTAVVLLLFCLVVLATMVYGPMGAFLVELFPTKLRYSGVSIALQFGNGWIGGFGPFIATAVVVNTGDIFKGLLYTVGVAALTFIVGMLAIRDQYGQDMSE